MIKVEREEIYGWETAIRGMRNPLESWEKSDSKFIPWDDTDFEIGENDKKLMLALAKSGRSHSKYRRMINVTCDITAPLYWWKEYDTYKVGTVANSCSTMHKIQAKEFTDEDFSIEHMEFDDDYATSFINDNDGVDKWYPIDIMLLIQKSLNVCREKYLETKDKKYWWQMIQLLPSSYNQKRTVQLNYEVLANMYHDRKNHKLDEWRTFCEWIESLPYSEIITGEKE